MLLSIQKYSEVNKMDKTIYEQSYAAISELYEIAK